MKITQLTSLLLLVLTLTNSCKKELPNFEDVAKQDTYIQNSYVNLDNTLWTWDNTDKFYYKDIPLESITQEVLDSGTVICNLLLDDESYAQLPYTMHLSGSNYKSFGVIVSLNNVTIRVSNRNNNQYPTPGTVDFKIVVVDVID